MTTTGNDSSDNAPAGGDHEHKSNGAANKDDKNTPIETSGDPGRTPGSAEGDEETIDEDIREKEAEGKL